MDQITAEFVATLRGRLAVWRSREILAEQERVRLDSIERFLAEADLCFTDPERIPVQRLRLGVEQLLYAAVELDELIYPQIDPNVGWVRWLQHPVFDAASANASPDSYELETQLQRFVLDRLGGLVSLGYKPRKADLCAVVSGSAGVGRRTSLMFRKVESSVSDGIAAGGAAAPEPFVLRNSKVGIEVRFEQSLSAETRVYKQYSVQPGIGAHLNYATTGFRCELWSEGVVLDQVFLDLYVLLPQATNHGFLVAPLESFGGVGASSDVPGKIPFNETQGFWGIQLTDAFNDFLVQYRFSRPLHGGSFEHLFTDSDVDESYYGTRITFSVPGSRLSDPLKPLTLFFSIM